MIASVLVVLSHVGCLWITSLGKLHTRKENGEESESGESATPSSDQFSEIPDLSED